MAGDRQNGRRLGRSEHVGCEGDRGEALLFLSRQRRVCAHDPDRSGMGNPMMVGETWELDEQGWLWTQVVIPDNWCCVNEVVSAEA